MKKKAITSILVACVMALTLAGLSACGSGNAQSAATGSAAGEVVSPFQDYDCPDVFGLAGMTRGEIEGKLPSCYSGQMHDMDATAYSNDEKLLAATLEEGEDPFYRTTDEGKWVLVVRNYAKPADLYFLITVRDGDLLSFCKGFESYFGLDEMDLHKLEEDPDSTSVDCDIYRNGEQIGNVIPQRRDGVIYVRLRIDVD